MNSNIAPFEGVLTMLHLTPLVRPFYEPAGTALGVAGNGPRGPRPEGLFTKRPRGGRGPKASLQGTSGIASWDGSRHLSWFV